MSQAPPLDPPGRLMSLDAYRGFIMLAMASGGLGFRQVADQMPDHPVWQFLGYHFDHVAWRGCAFWDLIQPSFMFMVGVAMAFSYLKRRAKGQSHGAMLGHAVYRSILLVLLGVFLSSNGSAQTNFTFVNVLSQIGLGYTFLFLLWDKRPAVQLAAAMAILVGYWCFFYFHPLPSAGFGYREAGLPAGWEPLTGIAAHWDKNTNAAAAFDRWCLNLFPRPEPFAFNEGGYQTLNFVPSLATMIFGLLVGGLLRGQQRGAVKLSILVVCGLIALAGGLLLDRWGICPSVKRIWTPSWAIYSTGWTLLMLAGFYAIIDLGGLRGWAWPLVVVGMNSIAIYCMYQLMTSWIRHSLQTHFGQAIFDVFGSAYQPITQRALVLVVLWLICAWLYRQRILIRI